ncbi:hypothetical protein PTE01_10630 [Pseudoalteromonas tetraodonis GFC]|uniref:Uncharacterized protein n=1 Tax=Pseudoalteromonas tetraodonis GFC TaxID=1315271 RepID=A0AA37S4G6_9GAMM|nr:hypothetical protein PTE01_10630 [Pseudoalteromonas tetraodonis GFC]GLQ04019.1 hypothetical protein GCM10007914_29000 [Pseudoalteromonas tetraodonis GFC]
MLKVGVINKALNKVRLTIFVFMFMKIHFKLGYIITVNPFGGTKNTLNQISISKLFL